MAKNYQNMSLEELFKEKVLIENKVDVLKEQIIKCENENIAIQTMIKDLEDDIEYLRTVILNIKIKVTNYTPTSIRERISFKKDWKENFEKTLINILENMDIVLDTPHKTSGFDSLVAVKIDRKTNNYPLYLKELYNEIIEKFFDKESKLKEARNKKIENNAQLEENENELNHLELEYYAIKLAILRKNQNIENVINLGDFSISRTSLKNASEFIVNMFDTNMQTEDQGIVLHRDLTDCGCSRDGGVD